MKKVAFPIPLLLIFPIALVGCGSLDPVHAPAGSAAPAATTAGASSITVSSATLGGSVDPNGMETSAWFEWGTDSNLRNPTATAKKSVGGGTGLQSVSETITGLTQGTTYYYQVVAQNSEGTTVGNISGFTTNNVNLVVNGSFEEPDIPTNSSSYISSPIPGWTPVPGTTYEIKDNVVIPSWPAYDGGQYVELDGYSNAGITQAITTIPGRSYDLGFAYSPRPDRNAETNIIELYIDNFLIDSISADGRITTSTWKVHSRTFTATGTSTTIKFMAAGTSDGLGGFLDDVKVFIIP